MQSITLEHRCVNQRLEAWPKVHQREMAEADYATGTKSRPEGTRDPSSFAVRRLRVNLLLLRNTTNVSFKRCAILGSCTTLQVAKKFFFFCDCIWTNWSCSHFLAAMAQLLQVLHSIFLKHCHETGAPSASIVYSLPFPMSFLTNQMV